METIRGTDVWGRNDSDAKKLEKCYRLSSRTQFPLKMLAIRRKAIVIKGMFRAMI